MDHREFTHGPQRFHTEDYGASSGQETEHVVNEDRRWLAQTYRPLPVVIRSAKGAWVEDVEGKRYLDCLAGYSALNFGHGNERILAATRAQLDRLTMTSRAFYNDRLADFARELAGLAGGELVVPMNTGAEAVETAIKAARAWGYRIKGVSPGEANIIVMDSNFHGRTTTIISFSDDADARDDFGPYTPGFRRARFGDANSVASQMDENTVAVLVEPIQGEAGVIIPPDDFLPRLRELCTANNVLLIADEIQSGLGRTGTTFACELWDVRPDLRTLGKALGGGIVPVSAVVGRADVLGVFEPGQHGSTFGGNPLAAAVGLEVVRLLGEGRYQDNARLMGGVLRGHLEKLEAKKKGISGFTQVGLWAGVSIAPRLGSGRQLCERLLAHGVLAKDTHGSTVRLSPPLTVDESDLGFLFEAFEKALDDLEMANPRWRGEGGAS
ncbi:ornithine--oxo-acid transaminase [Actinomycetaceae bacterium L2_0104]